MQKNNRVAKIAPSILSADFAKMGDEVERMQKCGADLIHVDVMDGVFVPNITFGIKMVHDLRPHTKLMLDTHLMIVHPEKYIESFAKAGSDIITVHFEACGDNLNEVLNLIKQNGAKCGVAINPDTPANVLGSFIKQVDLICMMSVFPGFGGQSFISYVIDKIGYVRELIDNSGSDAALEVDGGITEQNARLVIDRGADILVAGNAVFKAANAADAIKKLKE